MTYVALLRAVNLGKHNRVSMRALKALFRDAGCRTAKTFLQSGNVLFDTPARDLARVVREVSTNLGASSDSGGVTIITRRLSELKALVAAQPFGTGAPGSDERWFVTFLARKPRQQLPWPHALPRQGLVLKQLRGLDVLSIAKPVGGRFSFPNQAIEQRCGLPATTRSWNTVMRLAKMPVATPRQVDSRTEPAVR